MHELEVIVLIHFHDFICQHRDRGGAAAIILAARFAALRGAGWTDAQIRILQRALQPDDQEPRSALAEFARGRPLSGETLEEVFETLYRRALRGLRRILERESIVFVRGRWPPDFEARLDFATLAVGHSLAGWITSHPGQMPPGGVRSGG